MKIKRTFAIGFFAKKLLSEKMKMRNYKHTQAYLNGISKKTPNQYQLKKGWISLIRINIGYPGFAKFGQPARPDQIQIPKSKLQTGRLDFGVWSLDRILDLEFWSLDFGFWIGLAFVLFVAAPKQRRLDFGVWILDFGFGLGLTRHRLDPAYRIFPCHADSGQRIWKKFLFKVCPVEGHPITLLRFLARIFLQGFFFNFFGVNTFSSGILWKKLFFKVCLVESTTLLKFLVRISLQRFFGRDFF